eukprot:UN16666
MALLHHFWATIGSFLAMYDIERFEGLLANTVLPLTSTYLWVDTLTWVIPNRSIEFLLHHLVGFCFIP